MIKLYRGDCLDIMPTLPDKSVDMILCDLPQEMTAAKWDIIIPFDKMWNQYERLIKDNGAIVLFGNEPFSSALRMSNIKMYKTEWYWNKINAGNFVQAKNHPLKIIENILVFGKGKINYYPQMIKNSAEYTNELKAKHVNKKESSLNQTVVEKHIKIASGKFVSKTDESLAYPKNIVTISKFENECNSRNRNHVNQKPVSLGEYFIKTYSQECETVLDNSMGSGSFGVSAVNTNRNFIGIEKDSPELLDKHFRTAIRRITEAGGRGIEMFE